jgi:hypothetical protein
MSRRVTLFISVLSFSRSENESGTSNERTIGEWGLLNHSMHASLVMSTKHPKDTEAQNSKLGAPGVLGDLLEPLQRSGINP